MRILGRVLLRIAVALAILIFTCAMAIILVVRSGWFQEKVRERIISEIVNATGGRVEIGGFAFDWTKLEATVSALVLHGKEPAGEAPLLSVRSISVGLRIISMMERRIDLSSLRIEQPVFRIIFYPDGSNNFPPPRNLIWSDVLLDAAVRRYEVVDGLVEYDDKQIPLNVRGENLQASMRYERDGPLYRGELASRHVRVMPGGLAPIEVDMAAAFTLARTRIQFTRLHLATKQSHADLTGTLNDPLNPHGVFTVKATAAVRELAELFRLPLARIGTAAFDGQMSISFANPFKFAMNGRLNARGLGYSRDRLNVEGAELRADVRLTPDDLALSRLTMTAMGSSVTGSAELAGWKRFHFDGTVDGLSVQDVAKMATDRPMPWNGMARGDIALDGELGEPSLKVGAAVTITPAVEGRPLEGAINLSYDQAAGTLKFQESHVSTLTTRIELSGTLGDTLAITAQSTNLDDVLPALREVTPQAPASIPLKLLGNGRAMFTGSISGRIDNPHVKGRVNVTNASVEGHPFDRFSAEIDGTLQGVQFEHLDLARGSTEMTGSTRVGLTKDGSVARDESVDARLNVRNVQIGEMIAEVDKELKLPMSAVGSLSGMASATVHLSGRLSDPQAEMAFDVDRPGGFGEQLDHLRAYVRYTPGAIEVTAGEATGPSGKLNFEGAYQHGAGDWKDATVRFDFSAQNVILSTIKAYAKLQTGVDTKVNGKWNGTARVAGGAVTLTSINGGIQASGVTWEGQPMGDLSLTAESHGTDVAVHTAAKVRDVTIDGQGSWRLDGDNPGSVTFRFSRISVDTLHHVVMAGGALAQTELPFEGYLDGVSLAVAVALEKPRDFHADLTIPTALIDPKPTQTLRLGVQPQDVTLRSSEPISVGITSKEARVRSAKFTGRDTSLEASGTVPLDPKVGADLSVRGSVNLIALQLLNPDLAARGNATVQASIRGSLRDPQLGGRLELRSASLYLGDFTNGIDNANGAFVFDRNRATIEKLNAETGGGTVDLAGFIGFGSPLVYRLQANAQKVRVRYPEDVSVTFNAALALNGTSDTSTVSGTITLTRASFTPRADLAQVFAAAARPVPTPSSQSDYIRGMQFDVRIQSGPNFELQTSLAQNLEAVVDLRLRGTPLRPALIGTASVNQGEAEILGNRYTVNRGDVRFVNPVKLDPIFDINLETKARSVSVNIAISGTLQKLNVNYSSDPPMQPREIIALLTVGRAPTGAAGLSSDQTSADTSMVEAGGGLIGQAITAQLSSRLQRFFGASHVKLDPTLTGAEYLPQARLTIEQQVAKDITLTYITNLNRTEEEIVQIEWDFSQRWSAVAVREASGLFGVDFQYRKRFK
jgi:translocation and assembly module TamB